MTWRNPQYAWEHAARLRESGVLTTIDGAVADPLTSIELLQDSRNAEVFKLTSSVANQAIRMDFGPSGQITPYTRTVIPAGHNFDGQTITFEESADSTFTSPTIYVVPTAVTGSGILSFEHIPVSQRYVRIRFVTGFAAAFGEWWMTRTETTTRGPEQRWSDTLAYNVIADQKSNGTASLYRQGPPGRRIEYDYRLVRDSADIAVFDRLLDEVGMSLPFILDPAYDTEPPVFMRLERDPRGGNDSRAPAANPRSLVYGLRMIEYQT